SIAVAEVADERFDVGAQLRFGLERALDDRLKRGEQLVRLTEQHGVVERLLVAEVVVEERLVHPCAGRDAIDARGIEPAGGELVERRREDAGARPCGVPTLWYRRHN